VPEAGAASTGNARPVDLRRGARITVSAVGIVSSVVTPPAVAARKRRSARPHLWCGLCSLINSVFTRFPRRHAKGDRRPSALPHGARLTSRSPCLQCKCGRLAGGPRPHARTHASYSSAITVTTNGGVATRISGRWSRGGRRQVHRPAAVPAGSREFDSVDKGRRRRAGGGEATRRRPVSSFP
jgi:hypothetical protein